MFPVTRACLIAVQCILALAFFCVGCSRTDTSKEDPQNAQNNEPPGKLQETWEYWDKLNKTKATQDGLESANLPNYQGLSDPRITVIILQDMINAERRKCSDIASMPVLNVDPEAATFAADSVRSRLMAVDWLQGTVDLLNKQSQILSLSNLGGGFLLNLLNRSNETEDGIFWRSLLDQARSTGADIKGLEESATKLSSKQHDYRAAMDKLRGDEINVRVKLAERYGREFPSYIDYYKKIKPLSNGQLTESQIIPTLIGRYVPGTWDGWKFDDTSEFQTFKIVSVHKISEVEMGYYVTTRVRGLYSGVEHDFKLQLKYGRIGTRWFLVDLRKVQ